jgi:hypothetical protein
MKKLLGFVLIHPIKEDFVFGIHLDDGLEIVLYSPIPANAKIFKDFKEIENFVLQLEEFDFDVAKLFDNGHQYMVEFDTTVSSSPN